MGLFLASDFTAATAGTHLTSFTDGNGVTYAKDTTDSSSDMIASTATPRGFRANVASVIHGILASATPGSANYTLTAKMYYQGAPSGTFYYGIRARGDGTSNKGYDSGYGNLDTPTGLTIYYNPTGTKIGAATAETPSSSTAYFITLKVNGTALTSYWNGVSATTASNGTITAAGKAGFYWYDTGTLDDSHGMRVLALAGMDAPSFTVSPSSVAQGSTTTITLTGTDTPWQLMSPTFGVSAGSASSQSITANGAATFSFTAPGSGSSVTVTDPSTGQTATLTLTSGSLAISPTAVTVSTTKNITLTGTGTSWTSGTPGSPTFTASSGSIGSQSVASTTSATLTSYVAPSSAGSVTITDPTGGTATLTVNAALVAGTASTTSAGNTIATVTSTAATSGTASYTYQWKRSTTNGSGYSNVSGATSLTLNDTGLTNGTPYYYVIVATDASGATAQSNQTTATPSAPVTIAVNDSNWFFSPGNWYINGTTYAESNAPGSYFKTAFTGTSCKLNVDVSTLTGASVASGSYPSISYSVDDATPTTLQLTSSSSAITLASGLTSGTHTLRLDYVSGDFSVDRWTTPVMVVRINSLTLDGGASTSAPSLRTKRMMVFGDSITEAAYSLGATSPGGQDATQGYAHALAAGLDAEVGIVGVAGQGFTSGGLTNVPQFLTSYASYHNGVSRVWPTLDYLYFNMGTNGSASSANVNTMFSNFRTACATPCKIFAGVPFGGFNRSSIAAATPPDTSCFIVDLGSGDAQTGLTGTNNSNSTREAAAGPHPRPFIAAQLGSRLAASIKAALNGSVFNVVGGNFIKGI